MSEGRLNFTEYCKECENPLYQIEGKIPQCPPGYVWSRKRMDCIPKTEKDKVSGRLKDNENYNSNDFRVWGRTGLNGDGYAYEEPFVGGAEKGNPRALGQ